MRNESLLFGEPPKIPAETFKLLSELDHELSLVTDPFIFDSTVKRRRKVVARPEVAPIEGENPAAQRLRQMRTNFEAQAVEMEAKTMVPVRPKATRFTTDYTIAWGRAQIGEDGRPWKLIEREGYDYRTKRFHDCEGMVDAIFDDGGLGRRGLQGAGKNERTDHYAKFMLWGGPEKAKRRGLSVTYLVFERGNPEPIEREEWA